MSQSLNVVALISGGKDSFYSFLHCLQNGHTPVALANLYPNLSSTSILNDGGNSTDGDIDSFMYQTVGHDVVPLYAKALDLPLYRHQIHGSALQTGRYYDASKTSGTLDETEDLIPLLREVLDHHPEVNAVCSGAILSTYQRTRIESVALRLGLIPLAYLWQYPALPPPSSRGESLTGLLDDMCAAGCDSRIVKVASGGVQDSLLWSNVCSARTRRSIVQGMAPFFDDHEFWLRGAVLGEGGEYETLAVDGPSQLWKGRIVIDEEDIHSIRGEGGVASLRFRGGEATMKETAEDETERHPPVSIPERLDSQFVQSVSRVRSKLLTWEKVAEDPLPCELPLDHTARIEQPTALYLNTHTNKESSTMTISNLVNRGSVHRYPMQEVVQQLRSILHSMSTAHAISPPLSSADIVFTTIVLRDMKEFISINTDYSTLFPSGLPNPPARKTIACGDLLPQDAAVSMSVVLDLGTRSQRRVLHVQSRSYWAPANIGPYSQAVAVPIDRDGGDEQQDGAEITHVAGQIPLIPSSMEILEGDFVEQATLALQHLWRVGQERGVDCWTHGVAYLPDDAPSRSEHNAATALETWRIAHQVGIQLLADHNEPGEDENNEDSPDAWDLQHNRFRSIPAVPTPGNHLHVLPNPKVFRSQYGTETTPPCLIAQVHSLPRSAPIEWHSLGLGNMPRSPGGEPRLSVDEQRDLEEDAISSHNVQVHSIGVSSRPDHAPPRHRELNFITIQIPPRSASTSQQPPSPITISKLINKTLAKHHKKSEEQQSSTAQSVPNSIVHGTIYIAVENGGRQLAESLHVQMEMPQLTVIPCRKLWGQWDNPGDREDGRVQKLAIAITVRIDTP